jgi:hypothetical protein
MRLCAAVLVYCLAIPLLSLSLSAQTPEAADARPYVKVSAQIVSAGLGSGQAYPMLRELTTSIGARLSGSPSAALAVTWGEETMKRLGFQNVHLEPVTVPHWVRGSVEEAKVSGTPGGDLRLNICALGGSIATPAEGVTGEVVEVQSFDELRAMSGKAQGKIIFFNRPFDRSKFSTFEAYGGAVNQRGQGAAEAARAGGIAALVRSMTSRIDDVPHTGAMNYNDSLPKVPTAAVSTIGANLLDSLIKSGSRPHLTLKLSCHTLPDTESANVVGELTGSEHPEEVIAIGGHLDSWDKGRGAHDDGAGVCHSLEALRILKELGLKPKRTIRAVLFMNEENGLRGGKAYAAKERPGERHIAAIETDAGGFSPRGFGVQADSLTIGKIERWEYLLKPIEADRIQKGGGGADISELAKKGVPAIGLHVDGQRYFDYHHSDSDTIDKVNERELELGAVSIAILSYVLAEEGL